MIDNNMKNKVVSVATVVVILIVVIFAVKLGRIKLFSSSKEDSLSGINESKTNEQYTYEAYSIDKMILLNPGDEGDYDRTFKTFKSHYKYRYIEYSISKAKPEGIDIDFYKEEEQKDASGSFIDDTYYVTVKYLVINVCDSEEESYFSPQNFMLGVYDDNGFVGKCEPRGHVIENTTAVKGSISLKKDEEAVITTCYCVKEDILQNNNIAVQACAMGESKAVKMPYFLIETDGVIE